MSDDAKAEALFDEVSEWLARELPSALGDAAREEAICRTAVERYAAAKAIVDPGGAYENVTHFFGADGVGFEKQRVPALQRVPGLAQADSMRILGRLGSTAMALESAAIAAKRAAKKG